MLWLITDTLPRVKLYYLWSFY